MKLLTTILIFFCYSVYPQIDTTSIICLTFSENMSIDSLCYVGNYKVTDGLGKQIPIYRVGIISSYYNHQMVPPQMVHIKDTSVVGLIVKRLKPKVSYQIVVKNVKDKAGNLINATLNHAGFYFNGLDTNQVKTPRVVLKK